MWWISRGIVYGLSPPRGPSRGRRGSTRVCGAPPRTSPMHFLTRLYKVVDTQRRTKYVQSIARLRNLVKLSLVDVARVHVYRSSRAPDGAETAPRETERPHCAKGQLIAQSAQSRGICDWATSCLFSRLVTCSSSAFSPVSSASSTLTRHSSRRSESTCDQNRRARARARARA